VVPFCLPHTTLNFTPYRSKSVLVGIIVTSYDKCPRGIRAGQSGPWARMKRFITNDDFPAAPSQAALAPSFSAPVPACGRRGPGGPDERARRSATSAFASRHPSSVASRHLLPQGEKGESVELWAKTIEVVSFYSRPDLKTPLFLSPLERYSPFSPCGRRWPVGPVEGGQRLATSAIASRHPSSVAARHLLPQGEKGRAAGDLTGFKTARCP
jgi:hypothetical protein